MRNKIFKYRKRMFLNVLLMTLLLTCFMAGISEAAGIRFVRQIVPASPDTFNQPYALTVDINGSVFVADTNNDRILKFTSAGVLDASFGTGGILTTFGSADTFLAPSGIAVDPAGNVYVSDTNNNRVLRFTSAGVLDTASTFGTAGILDGSAAGQFFSSPLGLAISNDSVGPDPVDNFGPGTYLYVVDSGNNIVHIYSLDVPGPPVIPAGTFVNVITGGDTTFSGPRSVAVDPVTGDVFVADAGNGLIQNFNNSGVFLGSWGTPGTGNGQFDATIGPIGVGVDPVTGDVYVTDAGNNRIEVFDYTGVYKNQWGSLGTGNMQFDTPQAIFVDNASKVYVADTFNNRVMKYAPGSGGADFNGDGQTDLLWRNNTTGEVDVWYMNGATYGSGAVIVAAGAIPLNWTIIGTGDFNGDGQTDLLWRNNTTGEVDVWYMNGATYGSGGVIVAAGAIPLNWTIIGTGDFNGDGQTDLLWRNNTTGEVDVWYMNGATYGSGGVIVAAGAIPLNWTIIGTGDFNGDGQTDLLWRNNTTGEVDVWYMTGATYGSGAVIVAAGAIPLNWTIIGTGDFNGDGQTDLLWRNNTTGEVDVWYMNGAVYGSGGVIVAAGAIPLNWVIN